MTMEEFLLLALVLICLAISTGPSGGESDRQRIWIGKTLTS
jgi:hypothetical protein